MMNKLRTIFHPIFVFIGVQIAWIILMGIWINWYIQNRRDFEDFAKSIKPELFDADLNWVILLEGCFLMIVILGGVLLIFVFWGKQARLNRLQSNFISSVSHELKSPLASIQLYLETMKLQKVSPEEAQDFVEMMLTDTERLSSLIDNILEASGADPKGLKLHFQTIALKPFLEEVAEAHQRRFAEKGIQVHLDIQDSPMLQLDKRAMKMVFNNLIGNALRYSPEGSPFTIRAKNNGKYCNIDFIDAGMGLSDKDCKKVFGKFYRVQNKETQNIEGAGLGLYLTREIVNNHKGKIKATSEGRGKGSTFTVSLPINEMNVESKNEV
ncbi:MAG: ATP-binding protein [Nitrospinota bacterium]|nr:ATP-binding protein [Nitrospinota bacterium]